MATVPVRFCEPDPDAQPSGIPSAWWSASNTPEPEALDLQRPPELAPDAPHDAFGAMTANGR